MRHVTLDGGMRITCARRTSRLSRLAWGPRSRGGASRQRHAHSAAAPSAAARTRRSRCRRLRVAAATAAAAAAASAARGGLLTAPHGPQLRPIVLPVTHHAFNQRLGLQVMKEGGVAARGVRGWAPGINLVSQCKPMQQSPAAFGHTCQPRRQSSELTTPLHFSTAALRAGSSIPSPTMASMHACHAWRRREGVQEGERRGAPPPHASLLLLLILLCMQPRAARVRGGACGRAGVLCAAAPWSRTSNGSRQSPPFMYLHQAQSSFSFLSSLIAPAGRAGFASSPIFEGEMSLAICSNTQT
jgi:hypothetical protein